MIQPELGRPRLTPNDRCDRCGAQAYTRWRELIDAIPAGRDLLFCAHHTLEHAPGLKGRFVLELDDRALLEPAP